jgi:hypothetical protein
MTYLRFYCDLEDFNMLLLLTSVKCFSESDSLNQIKDSTDFGGMKTSGNGTEFCLGIGQAQTLVKKSLQLML